MNLKESFRYQNFLENMLAYAGNSLTDREHMLVLIVGEKLMTRLTLHSLTMMDMGRSRCI